MTGLADRQIEIVLRNRVYFGAGAIARLPEVVAAAGEIDGKAGPS